MRTMNFLLTYLLTGRAVGPLCVSGQQLLNGMTFDLDVWHGSSESEVKKTS